MKANLAFRSVKNSGLKTIFNFLNFSAKFLVVPGTIVDLISIMLLDLLMFSIYAKAEFKKDNLPKI